jgi:hypothetical protein
MKYLQNTEEETLTQHAELGARLFVVCFLGVTTHCGCIFTAQ